VQRGTGCPKSVGREIGERRMHPGKSNRKADPKFHCLQRARLEQKCEMRTDRERENFAGEFVQAVGRRKQKCPGMNEQK